jgi:hypothetical protein
MSSTFTQGIEAGLPTMANAWAKPARPFPDYRCHPMPAAGPRLTQSRHLQKLILIPMMKFSMLRYKDVARV